MCRLFNFQRLMAKIRRGLLKVIAIRRRLSRGNRFCSDCIEEEDGLLANNCFQISIKNC